MREYLWTNFPGALENVILMLLGIEGPHYLPRDVYTLNPPCSPSSSIKISLFKTGDFEILFNGVDQGQVCCTRYFYTKSSRA